MGKKEQKNVLLYLKNINTSVSFAELKKKFNLTSTDIKEIINLPLLDDYDDNDKLPIKKNNLKITENNLKITENNLCTENDVEVINEELNENSDIEIIEDYMMDEYLESIPEDIEISINNIENDKYVNLKIRFILDNKKQYEMNIQIPEDVYFMICKKLID